VFTQSWFFSFRVATVLFGDKGEHRRSFYRGLSDLRRMSDTGDATSDGRYHPILGVEFRNDSAPSVGVL
jgi:hypothetical protein